MALRFHNSQKKYFYFHKERHGLEIYGKPIKISRYVSKSRKMLKYENGRLILPPKFDILAKLHRQKYVLISLENPTRLVYDKKDVWGNAWVIFFPNIVSSEGSELCFDLRSSKYSCKQSVFYTVGRHVRISNGQLYSSNKLYLPKRMVGDELLFVRLKPAIKVIGFQEAKLENIWQRAPDLRGIGYLLMRKATVERPLKAVNAERKVRSHYLTVNHLRGGISIKKICKLRNIVPTTAWKHICQAFKTQYVSREELKIILMTECNLEIRNDLIVFLEKKRFEEEAQTKKSGRLISSKRKPLKLSPKEIKEQFYSETHKYLPVNMCEAITLYLTSL